MAKVEVVGTSAPYRVLVDGRPAGTLVIWPHPPGGWRLIDASRAHYEAGHDLEAAKAFVARHFRRG